jgi:UDP-N-acetylglucosamine:LPS N-acetylglucosamine transferase
MKFLLAWELGAGYGHVAPLRSLARELRERGHQCVFAVRHLETATRWLDAELGPVLQAPLSVFSVAQPAIEQLSYATLLRSCGFHRSEALTARVRAWRGLIELAGCDCLIADHSPTALLAARSLPIPAAAIGTGFSIPPAIAPMPSFRSDLSIASERLAAEDQSVLQVINECLQAFTAQPLTALHELITPHDRGIFSYAEFDHYAVPPQLRTFLGLPDFSHGLAARWGERRERRLFAYLRPFPGLPALLQALSRLPIQVLVRLADVDLSAFSDLQRDGLVLIDREVNTRTIAADCDVFVNYAAHGTVAELLLAGKPGMLVPMTREQHRMAQCVEALGAAITAPVAADTHYDDMLQRLLEEGSLRSGAEKFAAGYAGRPRHHILSLWCDSLIESMR